MNPAAFSVEPLGTYGNAGHYMLRTPSYFDVDSAISRTFKATERVNLDLRVEAFNVTNHPNFGGPTPSTGVGLGPNASQPDLKLVWPNHSCRRSAHLPGRVQGDFLGASSLDWIHQSGVQVPCARFIYSATPLRYTAVCAAEELTGSQALHDYISP